MGIEWQGRGKVVLRLLWYPVKNWAAGILLGGVEWAVRGRGSGGGGRKVGRLGQGKRLESEAEGAGGWKEWR